MLPLAFLAVTAPFMGGLDACAGVIGLCDFEEDANCEDPARAQVLGTIAVPEAGGEMVGGIGQRLRRVDGPLANELKHAMAAELAKRAPVKVSKARQSQNNIVASSKTRVEQFRPGEIIVKGLEPMRERKAEIGRALELFLGDRMGRVGVEMRHCGTAYRCLAVVRNAEGKLLDLADTADAVAVLSQAPFLAYAEKNLILQMLAQPNDEFFTFQWHYAAIDLPTAWDVTLGDPDIVAAVVDTGVLVDHPDLQNRVTSHSADLIDDPGTANDGDGRDNDGDDAGDQCCGANEHSHHGSHVAGTMGADTDNGLMVSGVTWEGQILPVRVLGVGGGSLADIADGIEWAAGNSVEPLPNNPTPCDVLNMSLGGSGESEAMNESIADAVASGCIVVVAAGNDDIDASEFTPANAPDSITVAAHGNTGPDQPVPFKASYSNFGDLIDIAAPGGEQAEDADGDGNGDGVLSTVGDDVTFYQGTSMAAPHVAGIAMLMKSVDRTLTQEDVRAILINTSNPDLICPEGCGAGRVSAAAALFGIDGDLEGPRVIASPAFVRVGLGQTNTAVVFKNIGSADDSVTISVGGADRDRCDAGSSSGDIRSNEQLVVDLNIARNAEADDRGECTITATFSEGSSEARVVWSPDSVELPLTVEVGAVLLDGDNFTVARIVSTSAVLGFEYKLYNLTPGTYIIIGLIDQNADGDYDDAEDGVGIYVPAGDDDGGACAQAECGRITVNAADRIEGADFLVAPGFSGDDGEGGTGDGELGDSCAASSECGGGLYCEDSLPDGYCSTDCSSSSDCPDGGLCFSLEDIAGEVYQVCLKPCTEDAECGRAGYVCDVDGTCFPG
jgi:serine protease